MHFCYTIIAVSVLFFDFMILLGIIECVKPHKLGLAGMLLFIVFMAHYWLLENC